MAGLFDDVPGLAEPEADRFDGGARPHEHVAKVRARIQAQPSNLDLSVRPFDFGERGRRGKDRFLFVAKDHDMQLLIGGSRYHFLELRETLDGLAVDRLHHVARAKTRRGARAARLDDGNSRRHDHLSVNQHGLPEISEYSRENRDGQKEIGERTGEHDRGALPDRLREEGHRALGFGHRVSDDESARSRRWRRRGI